MTARRWLVATVVVTLALSAAVAISWLTFGRGMAIGHPLSAFARPGIYLSHVLIAGAIGFVAARSLGAAATPGRIVLLALAPWIGQLVLLTVFGTFVANELTPVVAWYYWLLATGGPMQPIALAIGALLARGD